VKGYINDLGSAPRREQRGNLVPIRRPPTKNTAQYYMPISDCTFRATGTGRECLCICTCRTMTAR
jgi:hypothetical protein